MAITEAAKAFITPDPINYLFKKSKMAAMEKVYNNRFLFYIILFLVFIPAALLLSNLITNSVNVIQIDHWKTAKFLIRVEQESLTFQNLFARHSESRIVFPKMIFLALAKLTHWDVRAETLTIFIVISIISIVFYKILSFSDGLDIKKKLLIIFFINIFLFTPAQGGGVLWGYMLVGYLPPLCLAFSMLTNVSLLGLRQKILLNIIFCVISTFSFANGLINWVLACPLWLKQIHTNRSKIERISGFLIYVLFSCVTIYLFFYDYKGPGLLKDSPYFYAITHPAKTGLYFFTLLGRPISDDKTIAAINGVLVFFSFCILAAISFSYNYKKQYTEINYFYPWIVFGLYSIASGLLLSAGRVSFRLLSFCSPLASRYVAFSLYIYCSIVVMFLLAGYLPENWKTGTLLKKAIYVLTGIVVFNLTLQSILKYPEFHQEFKTATWGSDSMKRRKAALEFRELMPTNPFLSPNKKKIYSSLVDMNIVESKTVDCSIVDVWRKPTEKGKINNGKFEKCEISDFGHALQVAGWAVCPDTKKPLKYVVLVYTNNKGFSEAFAIFEQNNIRKDVAGQSNNSGTKKSGFRHEIKVNHLKKGRYRISAWGMDTEKWNAYQLANTFNIRIPKKSLLTRDTLSGFDDSYELRQLRRLFTIWGLESYSNQQLSCPAVPNALD